MATIAEGTERAPTATASRARSRFFANAAIVMAAMVVAAFPMTYFVPLATGSKHFLLLRHLHGAVFFGWMFLYAWQANLVSRGKVRLHRELGLAGVALGGAMVPLGLWLAETAIEERMAQGADMPYEFAVYNVFDLSFFACFFAAAVYHASRNLEWHRREVYVAAICVVGPAISRWELIVPPPLPFPLFDALPNLVADLFLVALALHDRRVLGRIHPVTLAAAALLVPFNLVEPLIARSATWGALASHLFGFA
jgi:hypothetical protein